MRTLAAAAALFAFSTLNSQEIAISQKQSAGSKEQKTEAKQTPPKSDPAGALGVKLGYFFFSGAKMRGVYDDGGIDVQLFGAYSLARWVQIYGSVEWFERSGHSRSDGQETRIWAIPVSVGPKFIATISDSAQYYFGIGPRYFYFHAHNFSQYVDKTMSKSCIGGFATTGFYFFPIRHLLVELFADYSYVRSSFQTHEEYTYTRSLQLGGFTFGGSIGYAF